MLRTNGLVPVPRRWRVALAVVTRRAGRAKAIAQFLRELRDFLDELDDRPFDWAVLDWKTELPTS